MLIALFPAPMESEGWKASRKELIVSHRSDRGNAARTTGAWISTHGLYTSSTDLARLPEVRECQRRAPREAVRQPSVTQSLALPPSLCMVVASVIAL